MSEMQRVIATTTQKYVEKVTDTTLRGRAVLALLKKRGRIMYNVKGRELEWRVRVFEHEVAGHGIGSGLVYSALNPFKLATLPQRGYHSQDVMDIKERSMNGGPQAIINYYDDIAPTLAKDVVNKIADHFYLDGNATGNDNYYHGIESFMGVAAIGGANEHIYPPDDSYAGLDTDAGNFSTVWDANLATKPSSVIATDWPMGKGDTGYDAWTPKIANDDANIWTSSGTTWKDTCEYVLRRLQAWCTGTGGKEGAPDLALMDHDRFANFKDHFSDRNRGLYTLKEMVDLGFPEALNLDGMAVYPDYGCPASTAYVVNTNQLALCSTEGDLVIKRGPDWDPQSGAWVFATFAFGNYRFESPKFFGKAKN